MDGLGGRTMFGGWSGDYAAGAFLVPGLGAGVVVGGLVACSKGQVACSRGSHGGEQSTKNSGFVKATADDLPSTGDVPFKEPKKHPQRVKGKNGFKDADGREWIWDPKHSGTTGEGHWDVQGKDGSYIKVNKSGKRIGGKAGKGW